jgi:hypothetical protein
MTEPLSPAAQAVLDAEPMIHLDSEQGRIGKLWWINSQPSVKIQGKDILPGLRRTFTLWGTCGYGRDIRISMEPVND